jgi:MFS family permease
MDAARTADSKPTSSQVYVNLSVFQFLTFLRRGVFYTFMINYLFQLMHTVTSTAALGTLNAIASMAGQNLLWGKLSDKYKIRTKLVIIGESIAGFAYILVFLVHRSLIQAGSSFAAGLSIIFGLSALEFFWSMSDVGWAALLTDITTLHTRGRIVGALNFIASLGRMAGIVFAGFLYADGAGFSNGTIFFMVPILLLIGVIIMIFTSRRVVPDKGTPEIHSLPTAEKSKKPLENTAHKRLKIRRRIRNIIPSLLISEDEKPFHWFLATLIVIILGAASINQIFLLFINLQEGPIHASDVDMSLILSVWTVGGMIASLAAGRVADKIGRKKVIFTGLCLATVTPLLYAFVPDVPVMAVVYGLNGVAFWTIQTVGFALAGDLIPVHRRARLLSRYNAVMALSWGPAGILIGAPLADIQVNGLGITHLSAYINTFYVSVAILILGTVMFAAKVRRPAHETQT